jgi:hypothetical protein
MTDDPNQDRQAESRPGAQETSRAGSETGESSRQDQERDESAVNEESQLPEELQVDSFGELAGFTLAGFVSGLVVAMFLDGLGWSRSGLGQALVRTLAGEGESLFEGFFAIRRRLLGAVGSMAEAYGWGKLLGMAFPWLIDLASRLAGVDVYGIEGFYIAYFYSMSDQLGANLLGVLFLRRQESSWAATWGRYFTHPVMLASLGVILAVPIGLLAARLLGFSPTTQVLTALETIAANLCWVPPIVGWMLQKDNGPSGD